MYFDPKSSGARIKKLRTAHGLTQEQFSQHLNISDSHLRKMESGVSGGSIDLLVEIAEYFDVSLDYLVLGKTLSEEVMRNRVELGIENAIHSVAGLQLREECNLIMKQKRMQYGEQYEEPIGQAVLTKGYNLPAQYMIHTVGPIVRGVLNQQLKQDLSNCYHSVLECCVENGIRSVAFCCISTGEFHFPNDEAANIAVQTVTKFLYQYASEFDRIIFNVFKDLDKHLYENAIEGIL